MSFQDVIHPHSKALFQQQQMSGLEILLLKTGIQLFKSNQTIDKVNATVGVFQQFDTNRDGELDESELKQALRLVQNQIKQSVRNGQTQQAAMLTEFRALIIFMTASLRMWDRDPRGCDAKFSNSIPKVFGLIPVASWDRNPKKAKLEKIICTFYSSGNCANLVEKIKSSVKDGISDQIQEELFGTTFQEIVENIAEDIFGHAAGDLLIGLLF